MKYMVILSVLRSRARPQRALCVDIDGVKRGLRGNKQPVALAPAKANVGDEFRHGDRADMGAVKRVAVHAARSRGPHIAVGVAAEAVVVPSDNVAKMRGLATVLSGLTS